MKRAIALLLAAVMVLSLAGCGEKQEQTSAVKPLAEAVYPEMVPYPDAETYGDGDAYWAAYEAWRKGQNDRRSGGKPERVQAFQSATMGKLLGETGGENKVYSPANLYMALSMLAELTDGESRAQILQLLHCDDIEAVRTQVDALWKRSYCNDGAATTVLANSLWLNEDVTFRQSTMDLLAKTYRASAYQGAMGSKELNTALQNWLNTQTLGLLKEQIQNVELDAQTILALASTIAFQAKWDEEFSESKTNTDIFHSAKGDVECEFMHMGGSNQYYWGEHFAAIVRNFASGEEMWFFLPDEGVTPEELAADPEVTELLQESYSWENSKYLIVNQSIPKFDVTSQMELSDALRELGVTDVFDGAAADFSPMVEETSGVAVSQVKHDARVMIDEEGCTAVAYTVIPMAGAAAPPKEEVDFVLDRPFLFAINGLGGTPLFAGVVNTPD